MSHQPRDPIVASVRWYAESVLEWVERNGWAGWDPYDLWDNAFGQWAMERRTVAQRLLGGIVSRAEELAPIAVRRAMRVRRHVNPKAIGLLAASFVRLAHLGEASAIVDEEPRYVRFFRWLDEHRVPCGEGFGWGYPFDWRTRVLIPRGTPTVVTSAVIGDAYWQRYRLLGDVGALRSCEAVCRFVLTGLNRSSTGREGTFCFSYTPLDHFEVHNANLLGAEFVVRVGQELDRREWVELGLAAARFSVDDRLPDGTLSYWSTRQQGAQAQQDTYHSGFEIRALDGIARATGSAEFRRAANDYFATWRRDFFGPDGAPGFVRGRFDVVEIHSCAEALLCAAAMRESGVLTAQELARHVSAVLEATARALWREVGPGVGYFAWARRQRYGFSFTTDIPMMRWGQAWMAAALTASLAALQPSAPAGGREKGDRA